MENAKTTGPVKDPYQQSRAMHVIYVLGPYRSSHSWGIEINTERARQYARWLMSVNDDVIAICPHVNTKSMDGHSIGHNQILDGYLEMISRGVYDELHALPGWDVSEGSLAEIEAGKKAGTPIHIIKRSSLARIIEQQMFRGIEMP